MDIVCVVDSTYLCMSPRLRGLRAQLRRSQHNDSACGIPTPFRASRTSLNLYMVRMAKMDTHK